MDHRRKMRILHVLKSSAYSGTENVVMSIMKCLQDELDMVYVATDGEIRKQLEQQQLPMELLPQFGMTGLNKVIRKYQPDIVHAHDFSASVMCAMIPGRFRLISHLHCSPSWSAQCNLKSLVYRLCEFRISKVLTVTNQMFEPMVYAGAYQRKQVVLLNPIDREKILQLAAETSEKEMSLYSDLLFVGRLVPEKNPQRFIQLVYAIKQNGKRNIKAEWLETVY